MSELESISVEIECAYKDGEVRRMAIKPEDYFDDRYLLGGEDVLESIPKHDDLRGYLPAATAADIRSIRVDVTDRSVGRSVVTKVEYWNAGASSLQHRCDLDSGGQVTAEAKVVSQLVRVGALTGWAITRFEGVGNSMRAVSTSFVKQLPDGSQLDNPIEV